MRTPRVSWLMAVALPLSATMWTTSTWAGPKRVEMGLPEDPYPCYTGDCRYTGSPYATQAYLGYERGSEAGRSVLAIYDLDQDGYEDMVIGAPSADEYTGAVHIIYGTGDMVYGKVELLETVTIRGEGPGSHFGFAMVSGDYTGNGISDLAIGAPGEPRSMEGRVYVLPGGQRLQSTVVNEVPGVISLTTGDTSSQFGYALDSGDLDNNGHADLIIGAPGEDRVYILPTILDPTLPPELDLYFTFDPGEGSGQEVCYVGDVNTNGFFDFAVGAPLAFSGAGRVYLVDGLSVFQMNIGLPPEEETSSDRVGPQIENLVLDIRGDLTAATGEPGGALGTAIAPIGDGNGDRYLDVALGVPFAPDNEAGEELPGRVYILGGSPSLFGYTVPLSELTTFWVGECDAQEFGASLHISGSATGRGSKDLLIGAPGDVPGSLTDSTQSGSVYMVDLPGSDWPVGGAPVTDYVLYHFWSAEEGGRAGSAVFGAPLFDLDADEYPEILIGVPLGTDAQGLAYLVSLGDFMDRDGDGQSRTAGDCNDQASNVLYVPDGSNEICDGLDNDCDGLVDDEDDLVQGQHIYYMDADHDGFGDADVIVAASCSALPPEGGVERTGDCDDSDFEVNPRAPEVCDGVDNDCDGLVDDEDPSLVDAYVFYVDEDGDGFGHPAATVLSCSPTQPEGTSDQAGDCNDSDPAVNPLAEEVCDGVDNDCDTLVDIEDPSLHGLAFYPDADGDGYGDGTEPPIVGCVSPPPEGLVEDNTDCNDHDPDVHPGAPERCDGVDNNCENGILDEEMDEDGDGFPACSAEQADCDDTNPHVYPGADEVCDGVDTNCDGVLLDEASEADRDGDGVMSCAGDCDDTDPAVHPGADEICDGVDTNCDSIADEDDPAFDQDGDGALDPVVCQAYTGSSPLDCDDTSPGRHPGAEEVCNGIDDDCDGDVPDDEADADGDGVMACEGDCDDQDGDVRPGADEVCNGVDDDCDGDVPDDEADADGDGFMVCADDCDDGDPRVYPGADEVEGDGVDNDCDGSLIAGTPGLVVDETASCACSLRGVPASSSRGAVLCLVLAVATARRRSRDRTRS